VCPSTSSGRPWALEYNRFAVSRCVAVYFRPSPTLCYDSRGDPHVDESSARTKPSHRQELALGHYRAEEELLTEAVGLLTQRNALREQIEAGARQLAGGEYTDYDRHTLREHFDDLKVGKRFSTRRD
jgi:hypothetical protein